MINIADKHVCCGCEACVQACVKNCITMTADEEGFLYPLVDLSQCSHCGLCVKACPSQKKLTQETITPQYYAACACDQEIRQHSSSGGVFSLLADWIFSQNGVVFGAAFDTDFSVHQVMAENMEQLAALRGSKYVQSRTKETYAQTKQLLQSGRKVLYTGTACQIAGLKSYLGGDMPGLYTVDVLCHGVPSPKIWQQYLREQELAYGAKVCSVNFRKKQPGWKQYSVEMHFTNDARYCKILQEEPFMQCFLNDICLRPSCHVCKFKGLPRVSDLTIGDAWGITKHMPQMDDDCGTSVVAVHTPKGEALWNGIRDRIRCQQGSEAVLMGGNPAFHRSAKPHPKRKRFFTAANSGAPIASLQRFARKTVAQKSILFAKRCVKKILRLGR